MQDHLGLDADYRARTQCTLYTAEAHIVYLRELRLGQAISVQTQVLGVDRKRIRLFHRMFAKDGGFRAATMELMLLHFNQGTGSTAPFPAGIERRLHAVADAQATLEWPAEAGRSVRAVGA